MLGLQSSSPDGNRTDTLEAGRIADLFAVAGDPSTDLELLAHVRLVVHGGVVIRNELPGDRMPAPYVATARVGPAMTGKMKAGRDR